MPHIISRNFQAFGNPVFRKSGKRDNMTDKHKDHVDGEAKGVDQKIPKTYDSVKEASGAKQQVQARLKK